VRKESEGWTRNKSKEGERDLHLHAEGRSVRLYLAWRLLRSSAKVRSVEHGNTRTGFGCLCLLFSHAPVRDRRQRQVDWVVRTEPSIRPVEDPSTAASVLDDAPANGVV
jgi:hypothetical protein